MTKIQHKLELFLYALVLTCTLSTQLHAQLATGKAKFLGNVQSIGLPAANFDMYWNQVTPGNGGKWASCEQKRDSLNTWLWLDRTYNHAKQLGIPFKEHTLIWGGASGDPTWMSSVPESEQKAEVLAWFDTLSKRYPDFDMIDVVNEPLHKTPVYINAIGGTGATNWDWVIWCYEQARIYFPKAQLILNEYNILNYENECKNFLVIARLLKERNLVDGIGCQAHTLENIPIATIKKNLDSLASTGLDIYISEYEVQGDDATQLKIFKEQFPVLYEHPAVKGITLWGYIENDMWRSTAYLLKADGITERPALAWLKEYFAYSTSNTKYKLDIKVVGSGSVTVSPKASAYVPFTNVTLTAVPDAGCSFVSWDGDKWGTDATFTIAMTNNRQYTAKFTSSTAITALQKPQTQAQLQLRTDGRSIHVVLPEMLSTNINSSVEMIISDLLGKQVYSSDITSSGDENGVYNVKLHKLGVGSYFVHVKVGNVVSQKTTIVFTK